MGKKIIWAYYILGVDCMTLDNKFWGKIKKKTKVDKETIIDLAKKLQNGNMKDENTLGEIIDTLSKITGKEVSSDKKKKIINKVVNDKVPGNIDKMF